jgi:hypothetical protein
VAFPERRSRQERKADREAVGADWERAEGEETDWWELVARRDR